MPDIEQSPNTDFDFKPKLLQNVPDLRPKMSSKPDIQSIPFNNLPDIVLFYLLLV